MKKFSLMFLFCGCAVSTQQFTDISYEDGLVVREITGKSRTMSPPLKSAQSLANHSLEMTEVGDGWTVLMGSKNDLKGGEFSPEMKRFVSLIGGM